MTWLEMFSKQWTMYYKQFTLERYKTYDGTKFPVSKKYPILRVINNFLSICSLVSRNLDHGTDIDFWPVWSKWLQIRRKHYSSIRKWMGKMFDNLQDECRCKWKEMFKAFEANRSKTFLEKICMERKKWTSCQTPTLHYEKVCTCSPFYLMFECELIPSLLKSIGSSST